MDEIEFKRAVTNLNILIATCTEHTDVNAVNALKTIAGMLVSLQEQINEIIEASPDDDE